MEVRPKIGANALPEWWEDNRSDSRAYRLCGGTLCVFHLHVVDSERFRRSIIDGVNNGTVGYRTPLFWQPTPVWFPLCL